LVTNYRHPRCSTVISTALATAVWIWYMACCVFEKLIVTQLIKRFWRYLRFSER